MNTITRKFSGQLLLAMVAGLLAGGWAGESVGASVGIGLNQSTTYAEVGAHGNTINGNPRPARASNLLDFYSTGNPVAVLPSAQLAVAPQALLAVSTASKTVGSGTVAETPGEHQARAQHKKFSYDNATNTIIVRDGSIDGFHRHFGGIAEGKNGRLHLVYGKNTTHGVTAGATSYYCYSDDGGATWSPEVIVIPVDAGADQRNLSLGVTPSGRLLLIYAKVLSPAVAPTVFCLRYSDDNGVTWKQGAEITLIAYKYARAYGRIKIIPGGNGKPYRMAITPYYRSGSKPTTYRSAVWLSDDDGLTWKEGAPIINDITGQTETELVAIDALLWFAVTRGATGLTLYKTTDGGMTWASLGIVPVTSSDSWVAPTLDKFKKDGAWFLLLGYCNRVTDEATFRVAPVSADLTSSAAFGSKIVVATDMANASGYQSLITKPDGSLYLDGGTGYVEFKEYKGFAYSQVRFVRIDLPALLAKTSRSRSK